MSKRYLRVCAGCGEQRMIRSDTVYCTQACASQNMARKARADQGAASATWKGERIGWSAVHVRKVVANGKASTHVCVFCEGTATDWAWNNAGDPRTDLAHLFAACKTDHRRFDISTSKTERDVATGRQTYSK